MGAGTLRKSRNLCFSRICLLPCEGNGSAAQDSPQTSSRSKALPSHPRFHFPSLPTSPLQLPTPLPPQQVLGARRACAFLGPCPAFHVSLPSLFLRSSSTAAPIGQPTSSPCPINAGLSPPCYWVEQNKNSERGLRRCEAAAEAEEQGRVSGPGTWASCGGGSGGSVPARLARTAPSPPAPVSSDADARWEGEGAWRVRARVVRSGSAGLEPGRILRARMAPLCPPQRPGLRGVGPKFPPPRPGPGARRRGPAPSRTPSGPPPGPTPGPPAR